MGTIQITRSDDHYLKTSIGTHSEGIIDFRYNGVTITSTTNSVNSTTFSFFSRLFGFSKPFEF